MTDVHSKQTRSYNMSQIRSKNTAPELVVRKFLFSNGYRFKLHDASLPGKPDLVLKKLNTAIFVNGCFWHGHKGCKYFVLPKTRIQWWNDKIAKNIRNDKVKMNEIIKSGWNTITIWECQIKPNKKEQTLNKLLIRLRKLAK